MPAGETPLLEVRSVSKRFAGVLAVDRATFEVAPRTITALIGPNGAGKSTLFNVLTGFERGDGGEVHFDGEPVTGRAPHAIARCGMVRTFQLTKALAVMSVLDNMLLAAPNPGERLALAPFRFAWRGAERAARVRALELLESSGSRRRPGTTQAPCRAASGSCSSRPRPDARAADAAPRRAARRCQSDARSLAARAHRAPAGGRGVTVLLVEHDMDVVMRHSDAVIVMGEGRVITVGRPEEVRRDPRVIEAYLGAEAGHAGGGDG